MIPISILMIFFNQAGAYDQTYVDPYVTLGVERAATAAEIKQAYFTLVRIHSPERDPETFKRVRSAYERLRDPEQRQQTDMLLLNTWPAPARKRRPPNWIWRCIGKMCWRLRGH